MQPIVSVIMAVHNGEGYLDDAVKSILSQTFSDFEFIIIDDGSTDGTAALLKEFERSDRRIRLYWNEKNLGLSQSLNIGLGFARGEYIVRMDADDISLPERLRKQVEYMECHADVGVCGTWAELIGDQTGSLKHPTAHDEIYTKMLFENGIMHPTVIMRLAVLDQNNLRYEVREPYIEDYDLWSRAIPFMQFANIPEVMLHYRLHRANTYNLHGDEQRIGRARIYARMLSRLQIDATEADLSLHEKLGMYQYESAYAFAQSAHAWFEKLLYANSLVELFPQRVLEAQLARRWSQICSFTQERAYLVFLSILSSPLPYKGSTGVIKIARALIFLLRKSSLHFVDLFKKAFLPRS